MTLSLIVNFYFPYLKKISDNLRSVIFMMVQFFES